MLVVVHHSWACRHSCIVVCRGHIPTNPPWCFRILQLLDFQGDFRTTGARGARLVPGQSQTWNKEGEVMMASPSLFHVFLCTKWESDGHFATEGVVEAAGYLAGVETGSEKEHHFGKGCLGGNVVA